jgi:hypothetical protein
MPYCHALAPCLLIAAVTGTAAYLALRDRAPAGPPPAADAPPAPQGDAEIEYPGPPDIPRRPPTDVGQLEYRGKNVRVTGTVVVVVPPLPDPGSSPDREVVGIFHVTAPPSLVTANRPVVVLVEPDGTPLHCLFRPGDEADVRAGDRVTLRGNQTSLKPGPVIFTDCVLVARYRPQ